MNPKLLPADIYLTDDTRFIAKFVKFLMTSPTIWHWLFGIRDEVRFYHVGLVVDENTVIEQQTVVEYDTPQNTIFSRKHIVYRNKKLNDMDRDLIVKLAKLDLGKKLDILLVIGKTLSWFTGIGWFTEFIQQAEKEICVTRVAKWYCKGVDILFGRNNWHEVTTDDIDDYCRGNPDWEIVSANVL